MSQPATDRPTPLQFNFEQWRNDIQTFVEETNWELQQIIREISGEEAESSTYSRSSQSSNNDSSKGSPIGKTTGDPSTGNRLASLKEKLSKRMNQVRNGESS